MGEDKQEDGLTTEQAAIYDRQIRLWGAAAQMRMSSSVLLVTGRILTHLGNEVLKNACLAGVGAIVLCSVGETEPYSGYLGESLEEVKGNLEDINRFIKIELHDGEAAALELARRASAVCVIGFNAFSSFESIAKTCRENNSGLFVGECIGILGAIFFDLGMHTFLEEVQDGEDGGMTTVSQQSKIDYSHFLDRFNPSGLMKSTATPCAIMLNEMLKLRLENKRFPTEEEMAQKYVESVRELCAQSSLHKRVTPSEERLKKLALAAEVDLAPVAGVVGGVFGREIVKYLTGKDATLDNFFFFDALRSAGVVEKI